MGIFRMLGKIALFVGVILLGFGINSTWARSNDNTIWYIISGIGLIIGGAFSSECCKK